MIQREAQQKIEAKRTAIHKKQCRSVYIEGLAVLQKHFERFGVVVYVDGFRFYRTDLNQEEKFPNEFKKIEIVVFPPLGVNNIASMISNVQLFFYYFALSVPLF